MMQLLSDFTKRIFPGMLGAVIFAASNCGGTALEPATNVSTGFYTVETVQGRTVWFADNTNSQLYFSIPEGFEFVPGEAAYLRIEYLDAGRGNIFAEYDSTLGSTASERHLDAELHTRSNRVGSGKFVYSYQVFESPLFDGRQAGGSDFRIRLRGSDGTPFHVASAEISTEPFDDETLAHVLSRPWLSEPSGEVKDFVDNQSLKGKVLTGYQGWFRTPNDHSDDSWRHWGRSKWVDPDPTQITIDMWPYLNEYDPDSLYPAGDMQLQDGRSAYLFSSADPDVVQRHFRWMRKYNIDGAYLQRFVNRNSSGYYGSEEFVLHNVREAARKEGRVWAIEYDVSSLDNDANPFEVITNDWQWLVNEAGILEDPRYLHEDGKPVLFIWGFSVTDRDFTVQQADAIVNWFSQQGLYLIGGVNWYWEDNPGWYDHYKRYDQLLGWMERHEPDLVRQRSLLESWGVKILPHAWPGFSWHNLKMLVPDTQYTPRNGGAFYWTRLFNAINIGADQIFLGMFDEYDEGTAIMPMADTHPAPHTEWGKYIDNEGQDPFWYLRLSGFASEVLEGHRTLSSSLPLESELPPVALSGDDATVYLGSSDVEDALRHIQPEDGLTTGAFLANHPCRINTGRYFYLDIEDQFLPARLSRHEVTIEIEYLDETPGAVIQLHYDGLSDPYTVHPYSVTAPGSGGWKNIRWNIEDGLFSGRQAELSDFRIVLGGDAQAAVRRVSVFLPEEYGFHATDNRAAIQMSDFSLSWPTVYDAVGWRLFTNANPGTDPWQEAPGPFQLSKDEIKVEAPPTQNRSFYRLQRPARR